MNTISIDSNIYNKATQFAGEHHTSLSKIVENYLIEIVGISKKKATKETFYIAPEVKALETGFKVPSDLSADYKEELSNIKTDRYL